MARIWSFCVKVGERSRVLKNKERTPVQVRCCVAPFHSQFAYIHSPHSPKTRLPDTMLFPRLMLASFLVLAPGAALRSSFFTGGKLSSVHQSSSSSSALCMKTIAVVGASGLTGTECVYQALQNGDKVVGLTRYVRCLSLGFSAHRPELSASRHPHNPVFPLFGLYHTEIPPKWSFLKDPVVPIKASVSKTPISP